MLLLPVGMTATGAPQQPNDNSMMVDEVDRDDPAYKKRASINLAKSFLLSSIRKALEPAQN
jgi:hypothetical protein